jgi:hypothetical protein
MALNPRTRNVLLFLPILAVLAYGTLLGWFIIKEDSLAFLPRKGLRNADSLQLGIERVELTTPDSIRLISWVIPCVTPESTSVWFLYLHGNGGNISSRTHLSHYKVFRQQGITTFALGYRGYGESEGTPTEQGLYTDAVTAFSYLTSVRRIPPAKIFVFGYSLGSAIAIELAKRVDAAGVIVQGAFTSAPDVAREWYPFLPVRLTMKNKFDSIGKIASMDEPILIVHATRDAIIPFHHGQALFDRARQPKTFVPTGGNHNDAHIVDSTTFYSQLLLFLDHTHRTAPALMDTPTQ